MRKDEEPGFRPGAASRSEPRTRETITGVKAFAKDMHLTPDDARRLRSEGFISFMAQPIRGPRTAGITNVALYETAEGAKHSLAHELRPDVIRALGPVENLRYFAVPGIPGARGWTASEPARRQRPVGAGSVHARPRKPGSRSLRRPTVDRRAGDLRAHQRAVPVAEGETDMRKPQTLPLLIVIASLVLVITGCGGDDDAGTGEAPGEARQAEQAPGSAD